MWVSFLHRQERAGRSVVKVVNAAKAPVVERFGASAKRDAHHAC
jgi:hypothetical protein